MRVKNKMKKIVCLGDSLTEGYGVGITENWVYLLSKKLSSSHVFINKGVCGETSRDMLNRWQLDVGNHQPDGVIVLGGVNDILWQKDVNSIVTNIADIIRKCRNHRINCLLLLPFMISRNPGIMAWVGKNECEAVFSKIAQLRTTLFNYCQKEGIAYLDLLQVIKNYEDPDDFYLADGIHITSEAHRRIANLLADNITLMDLK